MSPLGNRQASVPLVIYKSLTEYRPQIGDFAVWSGWFFSVWYGVVVACDGNRVKMVFEKLPSLLFQLNPDDQDETAQTINLSKIKNSWPGAWAIMSHDKTSNTPVWYI